MSKRPNQADTLIDGDQIIIFRSNCTDYRAIPKDAVINDILDQLSVDLSPSTQTLAPSGNFTLSVDNNPNGTYLILNPQSIIASATLNLPTIASLSDGQEISIVSSKAITALTFNTEATIVGGISTLPANGFFKIKYQQAAQTWYRAG